MISSRKIFSCFILLSLTGQLHAKEFFREAWDYPNNPINLDNNYVYNFYQLPPSGEVAIFPWASTYFPNFLGGIAYRLKTQETPFNYATHAKHDVKNMSFEQLMELSSAEKYDIFMDDFSYPTVNAEYNRTSPQDAEWQGLCHGWAPAAINFKEPKAVVMVGANGIKVPFSSYDVKALLSYYQGNEATEDAEFLGMRCEDTLNGAMYYSAECDDVNAGAFHVVFANEVGIRHKSFVFDKVRDFEVWNQPIVSYSTKILSDHRGSTMNAAYGTVREVEIEANVVFTNEFEEMTSWEILNQIGVRKVDTAKYLYKLEIDHNNQIIGGEWLNYDRPDFVWRQAKPFFTGYYSAIEQIYQNSIR